MSQRPGVEQRLKQVVAAHPGLRQVAKWTRKFVGSSSDMGMRAAQDAERQRRLLFDPFFTEQLRSLDETLSRDPEADISKLFANVSLDIFALLLFERPSAYPHLCSFFPRMPSEERQKEWVGNAGLPLMLESTAFVRSLTEKMAKHVKQPLAESNVLDYGFGWGRLLRLMSKFVPEQRLYGFDPWETIVDEARALGVRGNLAVVPEYPTELPGPKFNLIYAFSIFTHLSERCHRAVLQAFHGSLADDGIVVLTVRPASYWRHKKHVRAAELERSHQETGFAFEPHVKLKPGPDGEVPYGDTTISPQYVAKHWSEFELVDVDVDALSPEQILLVLRKRRSGA
ncbi:MAG TPA: class I SAM-dependent methyltransferase [Polyangiaceae bacterium]|nr:class I SAM-dependent methyltransferase [Polyangiaceae bacterium]